MAWRKRLCYVLTAFYRQDLVDENETPISEEFIYINEYDAIREKEKLEQDEEYSEVCFDEEEREIWIDDDNEAIDLSKKSNAWLVATLDDEAQKLAKKSNEEWTMLVNQSYYLAIKREIQRRLGE